MAADSSPAAKRQRLAMAAGDSPAAPEGAVPVTEPRESAVLLVPSSPLSVSGEAEAQSALGELCQASQRVGSGGFSGSPAVESRPVSAPESTPKRAESLGIPPGMTIMAPPSGTWEKPSWPGMNPCFSLRPVKPWHSQHWWQSRCQLHSRPEVSCPHSLSHARLCLPQPY